MSLDELFSKWKTRNVKDIKLLTNPDSDAKEGISPLKILRHDQYKWDRPEWRAYDYALLKFPDRTFQVDHIFEIDNGWINAQKQLQGEKLLFAGFGANCTESNNNRLSFGINKLYQPPVTKIETKININILPKSWDFIVKSDNHFNDVHCVDKPFGNYSAVPHDGDRGGLLFRLRNSPTKPITEIHKWNSRDWHENLILVGLIRRNAQGIGDQKLTGFGVFTNIARIEPQEFIKDRMNYCGDKIRVPEHLSDHHMQCTRPYVTF